MMGREREGRDVRRGAEWDMRGSMVGRESVRCERA